MSGTWVRRQADEHQCEKPTLSTDDKARANDIWECSECHKMWIVQNSQMDGNYFIEYMTPEPYDPNCKRYARDMPELDYFWPESEEDLELTPADARPARRAQFISEQDGTYNSLNGHFLCDACYIAVGMPTSPKGWTCP